MYIMGFFLVFFFGGVNDDGPYSCLLAGKLRSGGGGSCRWLPLCMRYCPLIFLAWSVRWHGPALASELDGWQCDNEHG